MCWKQSDSSKQESKDNNKVTKKHKKGNEIRTNCVEERSELEENKVNASKNSKKKKTKVKRDKKNINKILKIIIKIPWSNRFPCSVHLRIYEA